MRHDVSHLGGVSKELFAVVHWHHIRNSTKYVSYKDIKKVVADLKKVYTAVTLSEAEENLRIFGYN